MLGFCTLRLRFCVLGFKVRVFEVCCLGFMVFEMLNNYYCIQNLKTSYFHQNLKYSFGMKY